MKRLLLVVSITALLLLLVIFCVWQFQEIKKKDDLIGQINTELLNIKQEQLRVEQQKVEDESMVTEKKSQPEEKQATEEKTQVQNQTILARESLFKVTSPKDGAAYCMGDMIPIKWETPSDINAVTLVLATPNSRARIGEYRNIITTDDISYSETLWNQENAAGFAAAPGYTYQIVLEVFDQGKFVSKVSPGVFSIIDCHLSQG